MKVRIHLLSFAALCIVACNNNEKSQPVTFSEDYNRGATYYYTKPDSSYYYFVKVLNNSQSNFEKAAALYVIAGRHSEAGDYFSAQESLLSALKLLDENDPVNYRTFASLYNSLANVTLDLKDYSTAKEYYRLALRFINTENERNEIINGFALVHQKMGDYKTAIAIYDSVLQLNTTDTLTYARLLSNAARTKWLADPGYRAAPEMWRALELRIAKADSSAIESSYSHLSDYYKSPKPDSALYYAMKRYDVVQNQSDPDDRLETLRQLMQLKAPPKGIAWETQYFQLEDSVNTARTNDRKQFALIRFDVEKSKEENRLLQNHIRKQRTWITAVAVVAALVVSGLYFWTAWRRKRLKQEAEMRIKDSQLKTSQKVHDVVANGLYRVMSKLEHGKLIEKEVLISEIEELYEKSRDISHEHKLEVSPEYDQQIHNLLNAYSGDQTKVFVVGNQPVFWNKISVAQKHELQLILGELMVNMKKHSQAKRVVVQFKQQDETAMLHYKDDGIGFSPVQNLGNGLNNTVNRIKSMNGEISFDKTDTPGVSITISIPLDDNIL